VRRWVTFHGFALNVSTDLSGFQVIRPCGKDPEVITSMLALLRHPVSMEDVRRRVVMRFAESFRFAESLPASG
jgi:lipoyl(octanoyl) transferase